MRSIKNKVCKLYIIVNDVLILRCITVIFSNKNHNNNKLLIKFDKVNILQSFGHKTVKSLHSKPGI